MNERPDVERLVDAWLRAEAPVRADAVVLAGAMERIESVAQRRRRIAGPFRESSPRSARLRIVLVAVVVAVAVGTVLAVGPRRSDLGMPSSMPASPIPERFTRDWPVPPRPEPETDPVITRLVLGPDAGWDGSEGAWEGWEYLDPVGDVGPGNEWIDIRRVGFSSGSPKALKMNLADDARLPMTDPAERRIAYGFVIDRDADGTPDLRLGMDNLAGGGVRGWVTDLETGGMAVKCFPRRTQDECSLDEGPRGLSDFFYPYTWETWSVGPWIFYFGEGERFYAWASLIEDGGIVATDYAPDAGWLVAGEDPGIPLLGSTWTRDVEIPVRQMSVSSTLTFTTDGRVLVDACIVGGGNVTVTTDTLRISDLELTDGLCSSAVAAIDAPLRAILGAEVIAYIIEDGVLHLTAGLDSLTFTGSFEGAPP